MPTKTIDGPKALAEEHWKYIKSILVEHKIDTTEVKLIGFHYRTAMIHGYKHGWVDAKQKP